MERANGNYNKIWIYGGFLKDLYLCHIEEKKEKNFRNHIKDIPTSPVVKTSLSSTGGAGSIPGQGPKIPHALWCGQKILRKERKPHQRITCSWFKKATILWVTLPSPEATTLNCFCVVVTSILLINLIIWLFLDLPWSEEVKCHVRLFATLWTVAYQVPPSMGFFRQEYWSGVPVPSPWDLPNPGTESASPVSPAL